MMEVAAERKSIRLYCFRSAETLNSVILEILLLVGAGEKGFLRYDRVRCCQNHLFQVPERKKTVFFAVFDMEKAVSYAKVSHINI